MNMERDELIRRLAHVSSHIKTIVGIGNNAAWSATLEAMDHVSKHPRYKQAVKQAFRQAVAAFHDYERNLIYTDVNRLFCVDDLMPDYRKRYGEITDREYYEYWAAVGATAYTQNRKWITSLQNKFRLSLVNHKVPNEQLVSWGMTADACLKLATCIYANMIATSAEQNHLPKVLLEEIFRGLDITNIEQRYDRALMMLEPFTETFDLTELEQKNIQNGLDQLQDAWTSADTLRNALSSTTAAFDEVFRTKGEQKKALKLFEAIRE